MRKYPKMAFHRIWGTLVSIKRISGNAKMSENPGLVNIKIAPESMFIHHSTKSKKKKTGFQPIPISPTMATPRVLLKRCLGCLWDPTGASKNDWNVSFRCVGDILMFPTYWYWYFLVVQSVGLFGPSGGCYAGTCMVEHQANMEGHPVKKNP